jgi:GT2 family glycosyltransferase
VNRSERDDRESARPAGGTRDHLRCVVVDYDTPAMVERFVAAIICAGVSGERITVIQNHPPALDATRRAVPAMVRVLAGRPNYGYAAGVNAGLAQGDADWYLIANSDVAIGRAALEAMLTCGEAHPRSAILGGRLVGERGEPQSSVLKEHSAFDVIGSLWPPAVPLPPAIGQWLSAHRDPPGGTVAAVVGAAMLVRDQAVREAGPMDERYIMFCEEVDWARRFRDAGWEIRYCPAAVIVHTGGVAIAREPAKHQTQLITSKLRYIRRHRGLLRYAVARAAVLAATPPFLLATAAVGPHLGPGGGRRYTALLRAIAGLPW